jgi:hypothetical protein
MPRKLSDRTIKANLRRGQAIDLRLAGRNWQQIADELGYASKGAAFTDVDRAIEKAVKVPAEQYVNEEVARLDDLLGTVYPLAKAGDLGAFDRVLALMRQRSKYLGLDKLPPSAEIATMDGRVTITFATPAPAGGGPSAPQILELPPVDEPDDGDG